MDDNNVVDLFSLLPKATEIANRRGVSNLQTMIRDIKTTIDKLISENKQDIVTIYELHPYWVNRDSEADTDKIIRRALIAQLFTVSEDTLLTWPNSKDWKSIKTRITALYDILEELGCFILRRGAIESYYTFAPNTTFSGKPSAATLEVSHLEEESNAQICEQFADLVRALRFAAIDKPVDESFAVKKELLSELALVIGVLPNTDREEDLLSDIKQAKGNSESLFDYKIINENGRLGVEVFLKSKIINVSGFPFKAFVDDNVNQIVSAHVRMKNYIEYQMIFLAKQLGEQLAAGDKAAAGIYGEKYQNEHRRDGHDDLFLFVEAVGQKVRHSDGIACCKRVAAQRLCDDEPVEVLLRSKMPMRFMSGWTSLLSSTAVKAECRW